MRGEKAIENDEFITKSQLVKSDGTPLTVRENGDLELPAIPLPTSGTLRRIIVPVSSSDILGLYGSYKEIVPNPGSGKYIIIQYAASFYHKGTSNYSPNAMASRLVWGTSYGTSPLAWQFSQWICDNVNVVSSDHYYGAQYPIVNCALNLTVNNSYTSGNGTVKILVEYRILDIDGNEY